MTWLGSLQSTSVDRESLAFRRGRLKTFAARMHTALVRAGVPAHLHGVFIPKHALLWTRPVNAQTAKPEDYFHVESVAEHALLRFKTLLLYHLATFERPPHDWIPALDRYLEWSRNPLTEGGSSI